MLSKNLFFSSFSSKKTASIGLIIAAYTTVILICLSEYFITDVNVYMGVLLLPYILLVDKENLSFRYLIPLIACLILLYLIPVKTALFLTLLFGILFLIESCIGKTNIGLLFLIIIISPIFKYFSGIIGFPIRLWLSKLTVEILKVIEYKATVTGNVIQLDGVTYSVDPACAGLTMMATSFIIALFILAYHQRKTNNFVSFIKLSSFIGLTFLLNIFCNLFRIIALVLFQILPDNSFHDIIGILSLAIYVILPLAILSKYIFKHSSKNTIKQKAHQSSYTIAFNILLIGVISFFATRVTHEKLSTQNYHLDGFVKEQHKSGVVKFSNDNALIYIKPLKFYSAEHNPMICWKGSGYKFSTINTEIVLNHEIYIGTMKQDKETIHTAWWFDNGLEKTINHTNWRWRALTGEPDFVLINVSASSKQELLYEVKKTMDLKTLIKN